MKYGVRLYNYPKQNQNRWYLINNGSDYSTIDINFAYTEKEAAIKLFQTVINKYGYIYMKLKNIRN